MNALLIQTKLFALFASMLFGNPGTVQDLPEIGAMKGIPWTGQAGVTETVQEIMDRDAALPPNNRLVTEIQVKDAEKLDNPRRYMNPKSPRVSQWPAAKLAGPESRARGDQGHGGHGGGPYNPQTVGTSFLGGQLSESGFVPPDTQMSVGPTQILMCINGRIKVFDKAGNLGALNTTTDNFFASVRSAGTSDPQVRYDRLTQRWFVVMIDVANTNNRIMVAVSSGPTITGAASFTFYFFNQASPPSAPGFPAAVASQFADYPSCGVDANAIYVACNMFSPFSGVDAYVIRKSSVTSGGPIVVTAFRKIVNGSAGAGPYAARGVDNDDAASTEGYFIGVDNATFGTLMMRRVSTPGGTPTMSANLSITVPSTSFPAAFGSQGGQPPDPLDDRLFAATLHKDKISNVTSIWTAHNIRTTNAGVASTSGTMNSSRWYQIGSLTSTPALLQSGTKYDTAASNPRHHTIPSVAMSGQGHMALGGTIYGNTEFLEVGVSGRLRTDGPGSIQADTVAQTSSTGYAAQGAGTQRWGDYSATVVDPNDDQTIWTIQEYCNAANSWACRIIQLRAPAPATPVTCVPASLAQGATNQNVVVTGTSSSGTEFWDPEVSYLNHIAAAFSGTGITVNSITFTDPTHITLNVSVSGAATAGLRNLTVTNPDGQQATGSNVFTVTAGSNPVPTITSLSPTNTMFGGPTFTLTVNGTNFVNGGVSVVNWNGSPRATTFVNANQVTAQILNTDIGNSGTFNVTVVNAAPGGGTSNTAVFLVNPVQPTSYSTVEGSSGGALSNLFFSDNLYVVAQGDEGAPNEGIEVVTTAPFQTSTQLQLVIESKSSRTDGTIKLTAFNYSGLGYSDPAATWSWAATASDSTQTKTISVNVNNFIQSGTKQMKFKVQFFPSVETTAFDGWSFSIDRAHWIFTP